MCIDFPNGTLWVRFHGQYWYQSFIDGSNIWGVDRTDPWGPEVDHPPLGRSCLVVVASCLMALIIVTCIGFMGCLLLKAILQQNLAAALQQKIIVDIICCSAVAKKAAIFTIHIYIYIYIYMTHCFYYVSFTCHNINYDLNMWYQHRYTLIIGIGANRSVYENAYMTTYGFRAIFWPCEIHFAILI